ncbi:hypothetical protein OCUAc18_28940 [Acinetobacter baumannii]|nr:hypothetical protein OCUAc18_28940 [Acinetobacter baumannii]
MPNGFRQVKFFNLNLFKICLGKVMEQPIDFMNELFHLTYFSHFYSRDVNALELMFEENLKVNLDNTRTAVGAVQFHAVNLL